MKITEEITGLATYIYCTLFYDNQDKIFSVKFFHDMITNKPSLLHKKNITEYPIVIVLTSGGSLVLKLLVEDVKNL